MGYQSGGVGLLCRGCSTVEDITLMKTVNIKGKVYRLCPSCWVYAQNQETEVYKRLISLRLH